MHGTTIGDLHRQWSFGNSLRESAMSGRHFNRMSLARIMATAVVGVGPLLQRASTITSQSSPTLGNLTAQIATTLPPDYTGFSKSRSDWEIGSLTPEFTQVVLNYTRRIPVSTGFWGCEGECNATVRGAGLSSNCVSDYIPIDIEYQKYLAANGYSSLPPSAYDNQTLFAVNFTASIPYSNVTIPTINMTITYPTSHENQTVLNVTSCLSRLAVVNYSITVLNGITSLTSSNANYIASSFVSYYDANVTADSAGSLGGIMVALSALFTSSITSRFSNVTHSWERSTNGLTANLYLDPNGSGLWLDPTNDILTAMDDILFRTAVQTIEDWDYWAADSQPYFNPIYNPKEEIKPQTVQALQIFPQNVFRSQFVYLYTALAIMILGVASVIPTLYGWWELGRVVSLSPIETANAFGSPLLPGESSNAEVGELVNELGNTKVRYGEVRLRNHAMRILAEDDAPGEEFTSRLEMAGPDWVRKPRIGVYYKA